MDLQNQIEKGIQIPCKCSTFTLQWRCVYQKKMKSNNMYREGRVNDYQNCNYVLVVNPFEKNEKSSLKDGNTDF